eukprot:CAMPEP_0181228992 /NCGR_PEP_ID=MMETSP1096-20121128/33649_1 /TAXON_ID=156174 ORGANISM="Chrysochromulina ericina, Strain CCMP281" /NCGR_SAMPLE_ID=MMETSP1096 /ASSEMBLY_ACC=CAM_ASM_000453 /LENGTH=195 /DNA_ID=CAMNT_0023322565 /DNA_START=74 /DNA_END=659 /DNA_ORIENTATION=-
MVRSIYNLSTIAASTSIARMPARACDALKRTTGARAWLFKSRCTWHAIPLQPPSELGSPAHHLTLSAEQHFATPLEAAPAAATPTDGLSDAGAMWDGYSPLDTTERSWGRIQPERTQPARLMRGSRSAFTTVDKCPRPTTCTHTVEPTRRDQRAFGGNVTKAAWGIWYGRHHRVAPPRRTTASHQRLPSPPPIAT